MHILELVTSKTFRISISTSFYWCGFRNDYFFVLISLILRQGKQFGKHFQACVPWAHNSRIIVYWCIFRLNSIFFAFIKSSAANKRVQLLHWQCLIACRKSQDIFHSGLEAHTAVFLFLHRIFPAMLFVPSQWVVECFFLVGRGRGRGRRV